MSVRLQAVLDGLGNVHEGALDVNIVLGGAFEKRNTEFGSQLLSFFRGDDLFVEHIALVPDQYLVDVHVGVLLDLRDPVADTFEAASIRDVVDE